MVLKREGPGVEGRRPSRGEIGTHDFTGTGTVTVGAHDKFGLYHYLLQQSWEDQLVILGGYFNYASVGNS